MVECICLRAAVVDARVGTRTRSVFVDISFVHEDISLLAWVWNGRELRKIIFQYLGGFWGNSSACYIYANYKVQSSVIKLFYLYLR
jgi:hypothetical protein